MVTPEISVIMPVYNAGNFLAESIESILKQTFTNFELIILNDKSTDNSLEVISNYQRNDSRIIIINKDINVGPANLRNEGLKIAKGDFIALMDADDIALPTRFEKQIAVLKNNPEIGVCGTWFTFFGSKKNKLIKHSEKPDAIKISFLHSCVIGNPTVMLRKTALNNAQFENEYVPVEDYDLWSRLSAKTAFYNIPESLLDYRQHDNNISKTKIDNVNRSVRKVKINQLSQFGIESSDPKIDSYLNAVSLKKGLSSEEILQVISAAKHLIEQNNKLNNYNSELLESHITKTLLRTIRNAGNYNLAFYNQLKETDKKLFGKINGLDKVLLFFKSLIGWKK
ncbi:glycosyltransferase family A protein [Flavobacterium sp. Fl-318]|uniref:Glycosyltransferase family A protein n=1 Tax=Flavobacterium cupriresistens TaxID=2893885 RepID=A0ABU4R8M7_9FLAO|nr:MULTISPECIES: glycosyltransferase family A protein [unclassified Flavobacterium]MDX6188203.1 glycosyltransferase family A protein [Flavobacterium sp. Fl-318]UFH40753.1 glycosyltransferase family 2 protein [Flavobacterium sp. F-323]